MPNVESGLRNHRSGFVRETTFGVTPTNPSWAVFGDEVFEARAAMSGAIFAKRALGDVDPQAFFKGPETHRLTMQYYLQRWLLSGGNPLDPLGDAIIRDADNNISSSLSILLRESRQVSGGIKGAGVREYTYARGAYANTITIPGRLEDGEPVRPTIEYMASKVRPLRIDQPSSSGVIDIESTDAGDTTQSITIEVEGGATAETVALNGTTTVSTISSYGNIDALWLDAECDGDIKVMMSGDSDVLATIRGKDSYASIEGDRGVPPLGSGSHGSALGTAYERFIDDTITRGGSALATYINSSELRVNNNVEIVPQLGTFQQVLIPGIRQVELAATVFGPNESNAQILDHLRAVESDIVWTLTGGTITVPGAVLRDVPERLYQVGQVRMNLDVLFEGKGVTASG